MLCWLRLQNAVTYDRVSSLFCRLAALPCELFSGLQSVDFVNILKGPSGIKTGGPFGLYCFSWLSASA